MRLLSFLNNGRETWGAIVGDGVVDLGGKLSHATLLDFIGSSDFDKRDGIVAGFKPDLKLSDVKYLPVIPRPEKIVCAVRNYLDHHQCQRARLSEARPRSRPARISSAPGRSGPGW